MCIVDASGMHLSVPHAGESIVPVGQGEGGDDGRNKFLGNELADVKLGLALFALLSFLIDIPVIFLPCLQLLPLVPSNKLIMARQHLHHVPLLLSIPNRLCSSMLIDSPIIYL